MLCGHQTGPGGPDTAGEQHIWVGGGRAPLSGSENVFLGSREMWTFGTAGQHLCKGKQTQNVFGSDLFVDWA